MATKDKSGADPRALARGKAIRAARDKAGLSQQELADAIGLASREAVSQWEAGKVGEIERIWRLGLCKVLGFEEIDLLLDPGAARREFDMPLSQEAKSVAYRWDDLPENFRLHLRQQMAEIERVMRESPELAQRLYPNLDPISPKKPRDPT